MFLIMEPEHFMIRRIPDTTPDTTPGTVID